MRGMASPRHTGGCLALLQVIAGCGGPSWIEPASDEKPDLVYIGPLVDACMTSNPLPVLAGAQVQGFLLYGDARVGSSARVDIWYILRPDCDVPADVT